MIRDVKVPEIAPKKKNKKFKIKWPESIEKDPPSRASIVESGHQTGTNLNFKLYLNNLNKFLNF